MLEQETGSSPPNGRHRERSLEELHREFSDATFVFFVRRTADPSLAADLNQELYLRLSRAIRNFQHRCSWRTFVFAVARNVLAEERARRYRRIAERPVTLDAEAFVRDFSEVVDPDERAIEVLLHDRLRFCVQQLGEVARLVIVGQYFHGITLRELTELLAIGGATGARAVLIRAQRQLKRCLQGKEEG